MKTSKNLLWLLLTPFIGLAGIVCYITVWLPARIRDNERNASTTLKTLSYAEADFRANDRDSNQVNDFWTGDVAGLYNVRPNGGTHTPEIKLILLAIAEADARPLKPLVASPVPYHGYYFIALDEDGSMPDAKDRPYKKDTGGTPPMGKVHNESKFGFCAYPAEYGVTGRYTFIINENNTIFRSDTTGKPVTRFPDDFAFPKVYSIPE